MAKCNRKFKFTQNRLRDLNSLRKVKGLDLSQDENLNIPMKRTVYHDLEQAGLRLLVTPTGNKSFQFQRWSKKEQKSMTRTLGKFPDDLSVAGARVEAAGLITEMNDGINIVTKLRDERRALKLDPTVKEFAETFLNDYRTAKGKKKSKQSRDADRAMLEKKVIPFIGPLKMNDVKRADIKDIIKRAAKKTSYKQELKNGKTVSKTIGGTVAANRLLACIKTMFNFAIEEEIIGLSVCNRLKKLEEKSRDRKLKEKEIRELYSVLGDDVKDKLIKFLLLTGQRSTECREMEWSEIENNIWIIPAERTKTDNEHAVPLSKQAVEILNSIEQKGKYVFVVNKKCLSRFYLPQRFGKITAKLEWEPKVTPHDLRRTCKTMMSKLGIRPHVSERVLNHAMKGMEATYDVHTYLSEKGQALQKYADEIDRILGTQPKKNNIFSIERGMLR